MNRKGFTLVELLAVILIISSISIVAVVSITSSLNKRTEDECKEQKQVAINAAKIYFSLNDATSVTVEILKTQKYLNEQNKTDKLNNNSTIVISSDGYIYNGDCIS